MKSASVLCLLALWTAPVSILQAAEGLPNSSSVVLEVNGVKMTLGDIEQKRAAASFQAQSNYYETLKRSLDEFADEIILEQQAKKENLTVQQLLNKHVNTVAGKDPSEETLRTLYESADTTESFEALRPKILDALREKRVAKAKTAYMQQLRAASSVNIRLAAPRAPLAMNGTPVRGGGAPVTLVEFADYECPYCQQMQPALNQLSVDFKGKMAFAYKDYPLSMHANAQKAAEAAHCAGAQGKYWEFHDLLLSTKQLDVPALKQQARSLKVDGAAFDKCLDSGEQASVVSASAKEATTLGIQGTPTFFINGRYISGNLSYERLKAIITEELSAAGVSAPTQARNAEPGQAR